jgi:taurine-pyruvate aminotransferase
MCYFAGTAGSEPGARYASALLKKLPGMGKVYYCNSGSEANEKAYKMVRQLAHIEGDGSRHKIIYRDRDYHGTTIGALSSTGQFERKHQYGPFAPGFAEFANCLCYRCPFGKEYGSCDIDCARDLETVIQREGSDTVGSVVVEPITAGGGVITPVPEYFPIIQAICRKYDILLHIDEVVCGLGRTGKWFGHQHYDVQPDLITMAKGVASGYAAIACTVTTETLFERFKSDPTDRMSYFRDISTFGGCAGGPAAALENLRIIERENLLDNVVAMGERLRDGLLGLQEKYPVIGDVRGLGLFAGLELVCDRQTREPVPESYAASIAAHCMREGVIIGRTNRSFEEYNNTLCLSPALIATARDIDDVVDALDRGLAANPLD